MHENPGKIQVPDGAENLYPRNIGPRIFALKGKNQILKVGSSVKMSEAEAMRFVASKTNIPVPEVHECYVKDGNGYILMTRLKGEPLKNVWEHLGKELREEVVAQLKVYMRELGSLNGEFYGSLWHQPCEDIFFMHFPFKPGNVSYGPYFSRKEYNSGLLQALANSCPTATLDGLEEGLVEGLLAINDETKVFSHGDLQPMNILVERSTGQVTGIIDWEAAGFSIRGRDFYEAKLRARHSTWVEALDDIFPEVERVHFDLLQMLDRALTRYTLI